jgi:cell division septal protein FtsQ
MQECNVLASEKSIGSIPWVRKVRVARQYPSTIRITLEERTPIAITASGTVHFVDKDGVLIPFTPDVQVDMPVVTGLTIAPSGTRIDSADAVRLTSFLNDASQCASGLLQQLSQIDFSDKSLVRLKLANSTMLMELSSSEQRVGLMRLEKLLDIVSHSSQTQPQKLNVCFSNMAYAQW